MWPPESRLHDALRECSRKAVDYALRHPDATVAIDAINRQFRLAVRKALGQIKPVAATLNGLPPSVVDRILDLLDPNSRRAMSRTCRSLRLASQRVVHLRAVDLHRNTKKKQSTWEEILDRLAQADATPVCASYTHDFATLPIQAEQLYSMTLSRARSLTLRPHGSAVFNRTPPPTLSFEHIVFHQEPIHIVSRPGERAWIDYSRLLCYPAPHVQSFQLIAHVPVFDGFPSVTLIVPPKIFSGHPASLRSCLLYAVSLPVGGCPAFSHLTLLDYSPSGGVLSPLEVADLLKSMPHLVTLGLALRSFRGSSYRKQLSHRCLKRVAVRYINHSTPDTTSNRPLLLFFKKMVLDEFLLDLREDMIYSARSFYRRLMPGGWGADNQLPPLTSVQKYLTPATALAALDICAVVEGVNYRLVMPLTSFRHCGDEALFAHLQSLTISADHWLFAEQIPSGPLLRSLCLVFMPHHWQDWLWDTSPETPWACRNLQELEIACLPPPKHGHPDVCLIHGGLKMAGSRFKQPISISLEVVRDFVRGALRYDARRLQRIVLSGIGAVADPDPGAAFIGLQQLAVEVEVTSVVSKRVLDLETFCSKKRSHRQATTTLFDDTFADDQEPSHSFVLPRFGWRDFLFGAM